MYFDLEDYRPDPPRIPTAISRREAVLVSIIAHLLLVIAYFVVPDEWFRLEAETEQVMAELEPSDQAPPLRFVEVLPLVDRSAPPEVLADLSDMDRRSATHEQPADAREPGPFMRGTTPEPFEGGPPAPPPASPVPAAAQPNEVDRQSDSAVMTLAERGLLDPPPAGRPADAPPATNLSESLRNLPQFLAEGRYDNPEGGNTQQSADIQFDSMGVDFGSWLLRFKRQVERNWISPPIVLTHRQHERVVIRFVVMRNGFISDVGVLQPASIPALTNAAVSALRLSSPTTPLPPEYPRDQMEIVATFHYNFRFAQRQ
jgi:TonB family protein